MNPGQAEFFDFIMLRTDPDRRDEMRILLEDGFSKQDKGTFTPEYSADYTPKMLALLLPQHVAEVEMITRQFDEHRA